MTKVPRYILNSHFISNLRKSSNADFKIWFNKTPIYSLDDEDAFKKRGQAFENEYIRRVTNELIAQLKKKIEQEKKGRIKDMLEKQKGILEKELDQLKEGEDGGDKK